MKKLLILSVFLSSFVFGQNNRYQSDYENKRGLAEGINNLFMGLAEGQNNAENRVYLEKLLKEQHEHEIRLAKIAAGQEIIDITNIINVSNIVATIQLTNDGSLNLNNFYNTTYFSKGLWKFDSFQIQSNNIIHIKKYSVGVFNQKTETNITDTNFTVDNIYQIDNFIIFNTIDDKNYQLLILDDDTLNYYDFKKKKIKLTAFTKKD